jgi:hypothetical protein
VFVLTSLANRVYPSSQLFAPVRNVSTGDEDLLYCNQVLLGDNFDPDYGWDSSKCRLHRYHASDVVECLSQMSSHPKFKGRRMYFAFVGDSRIRIEFHSFWPVSTLFEFVHVKTVFNIFCRYFLITTFFGLEMPSTDCG